MTKEWNDKYNPFNSWKALTHSAHFEAILAGKPLPPIVINMDLTNKCNYNCRFCMFANRERADPTGKSFRGDNSSLQKGYALTLPKLWKRWGAKAVCLAGGGEPSLHPDCLEFIRECGKNKLELGFVTNGYLVNNKKWWKTINQNCKFVGFSMDAGNKEDYAKVKGVKPEQFNETIKNIRGIVKTKGNVQVGFKFLLDRYNQTSIYQAARIARNIGCNHFQFRPAIDNYVYSREEIENIWKQISTAQEHFDSDTYKVIGVQHKFNLNLSKKHKFNCCRATMLTSTWAADGRVYLCTDTRGNLWADLINHYPNPEKVIEFWGSRKHWDKVHKINFKQNCDRCTLTAYNEFFEQVFIKDKMDRWLI